jgi:D-threo-aldose 1-dehydrogenase
VSVILGGGYKSGILATGAVPGAKYDYAPAPEPILERVRKIEQVCRDYSVPLKAAALQFVMGHPAIPTNIPRVRSVVQLEDNLRTFQTEIPADFWVELKNRKLIHPDAPILC